MGVDTFIARQPIFDTKLDVFGYELLHRTSDTNAYDAENPDLATAELINNSLLLNRMSDLTGGRRGFINITRNLLFQDFLDLLPREHTVIELLETIRPDPEVVEAVRALKARGHMIALDDFIYDAAYAPLIEMADIIKVDFLETAGEDRRRMLDQCSSGVDKLFLAEKVESREDFEEAVDYGYALFQGYFFCKPEMRHKRDLPKNKLNYLRLLSEISQDELDLDRIEEVIKLEMSLSAKLLRYLNSAAVGVKREITSIRQALIHMGQRPLKRWASLVAMAGLGDDKPQELVLTSMVRASFCEHIASASGPADPVIQHYLAGMFSTLDALLDRPMDEALKEIGLPQQVVDAIEGDATTEVGRVFELALACERGDAETYSRLTRELGLQEEAVAELYAESLFWADEVLANGPEARAA